MYFIDGKQSTIDRYTAGSGGVTKGDLVVFSSDTVVKAAAGDKTDDVVGIALETAIATAEVSVELCDNRKIRAPYAGTESNLALGKVYDLTDAGTVNIDDVTNGCCFCTGYDTENNTVDFRIVAAARFV